jgi:heat shock protein HslJ
MTTRKSGFFLPIFMTGALAFLGACALSPVPADRSLAGTTWYLTALGPPGSPTPAAEGVVATLVFGQANEIGGSAGCNSYGGTVEIRGGEIAFSSVVSTLMACADLSIMDQEARYFAILNAAERYEHAEGELVITSADGQALFFTDQPQTLPGAVPTSE